jgi:hypothetical protein
MIYVLFTNCLARGEEWQSRKERAHPLRQEEAEVGRSWSEALLGKNERPHEK